MAQTTNYSIEIPDVGQDRNSWGIILNAALESISQNTKRVDDQLGSPTDSSTPSLAYQLSDSTTGAVARAAAAQTSANTAVSVAQTIVISYLLSIVSRINALETTVGDTSTSGTLAFNADQAKTDAALAKTAANTALNG